MIEGQMIVLEGIDGAGTTSQARLLAQWLRGRGLPVLLTAEPTGGPIGSLIRQALSHRFVVFGMAGPRAPAWATMALLFAADRLDHLDAEILPNLRDGVTVVCDRYVLSSLAYQSAVAQQEGSDGDAVGWVHQLNMRARPADLTIVLDVDAATGVRRRRERDMTPELYESDELQADLVRAYANAQTLMPGHRIEHVDGTAPIEQVHQAIVTLVRQLRGEQP